MVNINPRKKLLIVMIIVFILLIIGVVLFFEKYEILNKVAINPNFTASPTFSDTASPYLTSYTPTSTPSPSLTPLSFDNNIDFKGKFAYTKNALGGEYIVWNSDGSNHTIAKLKSSNDTLFSSYTVANRDLSSIMGVYLNDKDNSSLFQVYHNGNIEKPSISFSTPKTFINPIFSFQGTKIAYVLDNNTNSQEEESELWMIDYNDGQPVRLLSNDEINSQFDENGFALDAKRFRSLEPLFWSEDGNNIYLKGAVLNSFETLFYFDLTINKIVKTSLSDKSITELWPSPDAKKIAYLKSISSTSSSENAEKYSLEIYNLANGKIITYNDTKSIDYSNLVWSYDSTRIAYLEYNKENKTNLVYLDTNSKKKKTISKNNENSPYVMVWTKNNKLIYTETGYSSDIYKEKIYIMNLDGSNKKELDSSDGSLYVLGFLEK